MRPVIPPDRVAGLERAALRAWPASESESVCGWEVRFSDGFTKRANSVQPIGAAQCGLKEAVSGCEEWYARRGRPCIFRLTPLTNPEVEPYLTEVGYRLLEPTSVMHLALREVPEDPMLREPDLEEWLSHFARMSGMTDDPPRALGEIIQRIEPPRLLAALHAKEVRHPVACGMAVLENDRVGLFDLVTSPEHRRRGFGTELVRALLGWGFAHGAREAYLQVVRANVAAWSMYERLGFAFAYDYRYLIRELGAVPTFPEPA
ncbi:MAG: GNAT family N-acetyltransferase [Gemmatimonadota bacterium]